jgi:hypothetical protein
VTLASPHLKLSTLPLKLHPLGTRAYPEPASIRIGVGRPFAPTRAAKAGGAPLRACEDGEAGCGKPERRQSCGTETEGDRGEAGDILRPGHWRLEILGAWVVPCTRSKTATRSRIWVRLLETV